jgi:hypothetical protein
LPAPWRIVLLTDADVDGARSVIAEQQSRAVFARVVGRTLLGGAQGRPVVAVGYAQQVIYTQLRQG